MTSEFNISKYLHFKKRFRNYEKVLLNQNETNNISVVRISIAKGVQLSKLSHT